ncbi:hypothetical protein V2J09_005347 [Rumex salicifolius]
MGLKFLVFLFLIFLSISISISKPESPSSSTSKSSNQEEENHTQGSLIHGVEHVGMKAYVYKKPSLHTKDVQVKNEDRDQEKFITYVRKSSHGAGGGESSSIHHSGKNRASSLSTHSSFVFPCIAIFGLILLHMLCLQSKRQRQAPILDRARQHISQALERDPTGPHEDGSAPSEV